jgi:hypothetical protein
MGRYIAQIILKTTCPLCGADVGQQCTAPRVQEGYGFSFVHAARKVAFLTPPLRNCGPATGASRP